MGDRPRPAVSGRPSASWPEIGAPSPAGRPIGACFQRSCTRARAARALYTLQQGPRSTKRAPSTAIEFQRARLRVGKTAFTSTTMWRMFAARTGGPRALARSPQQVRRARAAATSRVTGPVWLPRAPPKCFVVRSGHGVACRSVSTSPAGVITSCPYSTGDGHPTRVCVYMGQNKE